MTENFPRHKLDDPDVHGEHMLIKEHSPVSGKYLPLASVRRLETDLSLEERQLRKNSMLHKDELELSVATGFNSSKA